MTDTATHLARPLLAAFETANFSIGLQLGDLSNADAVRRARGDEGSSITWIVGHVLGYRCMTLRALGVDQDNPYEKPFSANAPATDGAGYPDIAALRAAWSDIHAKLARAVGGLTDDQLLGPSTLPIPLGDPTLLGGLSFIQWHEAYHIGVIGMLRVQWGYRHTHELALEAMGHP